MRRLILLQVEAATRLLDQGTRAPSDRDVHEARKAIKRARALVRLLRFVITPRAFTEANRALRDAGRALGAARDAKVLKDTLAGLVARAHVPAARQRTLRARMHVVTPDAHAPAALDARAAAASRALLDRAHRRVARCRLRADDAPLLASGLDRIWRRGRKAMRLARDERTAEALHEWRKQVKNYWHALEAHPSRGGRAMRARIDAARKLAKALGDDHDLAMLEAKLPGAATRRRDVALDESIARRRRRYQAKAFRLGASLYGER